MNETTVLAAFQQYRDYAPTDSELAHEIYHDDAVLEFPQSQERYVRGDKIARETIYYGEGWEAPEWRAPWRAAWQDEPLDEKEGRIKAQ